MPGYESGSNADSQYADTQYADQQNAVAPAPTSSSAPTVAPLIQYVGAFEYTGPLYVGCNGPHVWAISNLQGITVSAPALASVTITRPDGTLETVTIPPLEDSSATAIIHRVGFFYPLATAGQYKFVLTVTMTDGSVKVFETIANVWPA